MSRWEAEIEIPNLKHLVEEFLKNNPDWRLKEQMTGDESESLVFKDKKIVTKKIRDYYELSRRGWKWVFYPVIFISEDFKKVLIEGYKREIKFINEKILKADQ